VITLFYFHAYEHYQITEVVNVKEGAFIPVLNQLSTYPEDVGGSESLAPPFLTLALEVGES
jgi:hypothetical protein